MSDLKTAEIITEMLQTICEINEKTVKLNELSKGLEAILNQIGNDNKFSGNLKSIELGVFLKKLRKNKGLTQGELGILSGFTQSRISDYEKGKSIPREDSINNLLKALGAEGVKVSITKHQQPKIEISESEG